MIEKLIKYRRTSKRIIKICIRSGQNTVTKGFIKVINNRVFLKLLATAGAKTNGTAVDSFSGKIRRTNYETENNRRNSTADATVFR